MNEDLLPFKKFFRPQFIEWLGGNQNIYEEFEKRTLALIERGRRSYSARTIVEVMRHDSILHSLHGEYKINDHTSPDLARAFSIRHPEHRHFWEYRRADWKLFLIALQGGVSHER
jgi:hypothetical protein